MGRTSFDRGLAGTASGAALARAARENQTKPSVGAIAEIHHMIGSLADEGLAVVVISSYLPEILSLSDRILVSRQGRIVEELSPEEATSEAVMFAAVH